MRVALLILGSWLAFAEEYCAPPSCRVDSNCLDEIHPDITAKCCGGLCVRPPYATNKLIGDYCTPDNGNVDYGESCHGMCGSGLFCSTVDERCHAKHGVNCNCTKASECLSNDCRAANVTGAGERQLCAGLNSPEGEACVFDRECSTGWCQNSKCAGIALLDQCSFGVPCAIGGSCRVNTSFMFQCQPICGIDVAECCSSTDDCPKSPRGLACANKTCIRPVPEVLPGLDEPCPRGTCNSSDVVCLTNCNTTMFGQCNGPRICQLRNQLPDGAICADSRQCPKNSDCVYSSSGFSANQTCQPLPTPPAKFSVPLGEVCGRYNSDFEMCAPPGNMCQNNGTHYVCKQSGMTPNGERCDRDTTLRTDECVPGSRCVANGTRFGSPGNYLCTAPVAEGARCELQSSSGGETRWALCASGRQNCRYSSLLDPCPCDQNTPSGQPCCACLTPKTVPDGGTCDNSIQCSGISSLCFGNRTCHNVAGTDCDTVQDCGCDERDAFGRRNCYAPSGQFDCNCNRQCYLLKAPTASPTSFAPTQPTQAPSPRPYTPPRCDAQQKAWAAVPNPPSNVIPYLVYSTFDTEHISSGPYSIIQALVQSELNTTEQRILIDLACCNTCGNGYDTKFNSHIYRGYQIDCGSKQLIKLEDNTCNDLRNTLALLNCWVLSSAPSLHASFGALLVASAFML